MGACGCGDTRIDFKFPGPEGVMYGAQIYPGCRECGTPAGVILYRFHTADHDSQMWLEGSTVLPWNDYSNKKEDGGDFCIPVLDPGKLKAAMERFAKDNVGEYDLDGFAHDAVDECLHEAVCDTGQAWLDQIRRAHPPTEGE